MKVSAEITRKIISINKNESFRLHFVDYMNHVDDILEKFVGFATPSHKSFVTKSKIDDILSLEISICYDS